MLMMMRPDNGVHDGDPLSGLAIIESNILCESKSIWTKLVRRSRRRRR